MIIILTKLRNRKIIEKEYLLRILSRTFGNTFKTGVEQNKSFHFKSGIKKRIFFWTFYAS